MRTRIEAYAFATLALAGLLLAGGAAAQTPLAPMQPLADPAAVTAAFAARIGQPVAVLEFQLGEHYARMLVRSGEDFDLYEAIPGQPLAAGAPQKAGSVDCRRELAQTAVDAVVGARLLAQARAIAAVNGYSPPANITLGGGILCEAMAWRAVLTGAAERQLHLTWRPDGSRGSAREMRDGAWHALDLARLAAGTAPTAAAPPSPPAATTVLPGDGRERDFLRDISGDLARLQAQVGAPLAFKRIDIDRVQLSVDLVQPARRRRVATWIVERDGGLRLWREADVVALDCNRPFAAGDVALAHLPSLIATAATLLPPMPGATVKSVVVRRSGLCGQPHIYIRLEDERGYGTIEYDPHGRIVEARID